MITKEKIQLCAKNIVKFIGLKKEDCVYIKGGIYAQDLLEEVGLEILRKGAYPFINSTSDYYSKNIYHDNEIKIETLGKTPKHTLKMMENIDAYIVIEPYENPEIQISFPREKILALSKASTPFKDILYGGKKEYEPGKKWLYAGWPSQKAADFYNISYQMLERFILDGMSVPTEDLYKLANKIAINLKDAKKVYVKDELGTNFSVTIENRRINLDIGLLTEEMIKLGDLGGNLPAGEVFLAPIENLGEGKIFCPLTIDRYTNKILRNVELYFKDGKLEINKLSADNDLEDLIRSFLQSEEIDKQRNLKEIRTYNLAELGIGCNPKITQAIGYILTDEKINGSVHLAFGENKQYGGTSISQMHWDFVSIPRENITIEYKNGRKKDIMINGRLI